MTDTHQTLWSHVHRLPSALPASPFWHAREERLYWVDAALKLLWRVHPRSGTAEHLELPQEPGSVAPCRGGGLLLALRDGLYHMNRWNDEPRRWRAATHDTATHRFGEGRCDPWGRFWVSTQPVGPSATASASLHCLRPRTQAQPELAPMAGGGVAPSGLAWSLDGSVLYWADAGRNAIRALALSQPGLWPPALGAAMPWAHWPREPAAAADGTPAYPGVPGGLALDQAGRCWVAMYGAGEVLGLDVNGRTVARLPLPAQCPTSLCFGGEDGRTLFVTTARLHRGTEELRRLPDSGAVFSTRMDAPGAPTHLYWD